jgi:hypothetical protein
MRRAWVTFVVVVVALAAAVLSAQQVSQPATAVAGSGTIAGRVIDATTNQPVEGARVSARTGRNQPVLSVQSGADGTFLITGLAGNDNIGLSAFRSGYGTGSYGMRVANGPSQAFDLAAAEQATGVVLKLWKSASLSGFVTDGSGRPADRVEVTALPVGVVAGRIGVEAGRSVFTDQQGFYSIGSVVPARYVVTAWAGSAEALGHDSNWRTTRACSFPPRSRPRRPRSSSSRRARRAMTSTFLCARGRWCRSRASCPVCRPARP